MLEALKPWLKVPTDEEAQLAQEVSSFPILVVPKASPLMMNRMQMKAGECHFNCHFYVINDPQKKSKQITGWLYSPAHGGTYCSHSVVDLSGDMTCLTPDLFGDEAIEFVPDTKIELTFTGNVGLVVRNGKPFSPTIRNEPEKAMAYYLKIKERLLSGIDPYDALE